jgi:predicted MPP superfamily phosphohydrolase
MTIFAEANDIAATEQDLEMIATEQAERHITRNVAAMGALLISGALAGGGCATFVAPTHTHMGGAEASVRLQFSRHIEVNPGGEAILSFKSPRHYGPFGAKFTIDSFGVGLQDGTQAPDADLVGQYAQTFSDPRQDIGSITSALELQGAMGGVAGASAVLLGLAGARSLSVIRSKRRPELAEALSSDLIRGHRKRTRTWTAALAVTGLAATCGTQYIQNNEPLVASSVFDGSALSGSQLTGALAPTINKYAPEVRDNLVATNKLYDGVANNLSKAYKEALADGRIIPNKDNVTLLSVSDRHCNVGMNRVIKRAAKESGADLILDGGDDAFSGSYSFESACVTTFMDSLKGYTVVGVPGNHDSAETVAAAVKAGMIVLKDPNGQQVTVKVKDIVLSIVGAPDPRTSRYGQGMEPSDPVDQARVLDDEASNIQKVVQGQLADGKKVDIVMAHDTSVINKLLASDEGIKFGLAGHTHVASGPTSLFGTVGAYTLTEGSTGGAPSDGENDDKGLTVTGPLRNQATMTLTYWSKTQDAPVGYNRITIDTDGTVTIGDYISLTDPASANNQQLLDWVQMLNEPIK